VVRKETANLINKQKGYFYKTLDKKRETFCKANQEKKASGMNLGIEPHIKERFTAFIFLKIYF
jgi:hypothetical protein